MVQPCPTKPLLCCKQTMTPLPYYTDSWWFYLGNENKDKVELKIILPTSYHMAMKFHGKKLKKKLIYKHANNEHLAVENAPHKFCQFVPQKTYMTMENRPFEEVFPIFNMVLFRCHISFQGSIPCADRSLKVAPFQAPHPPNRILSFPSSEHVIPLQKMSLVLI